MSGFMSFTVVCAHANSAHRQTNDVAQTPKWKRNEMIV